MTTTRQQRTPLGAFFRTSLGAFGEGAAAPPVGEAILDGFVGSNAGFNVVPGLVTVGIPPPDNNCGITTDTFSGPGWFQTIFSNMTEAPESPVGASIPTALEFLDYTIIGQTSGERFKPSDWVDFACQQTPPDRLVAYRGTLPNPLHSYNNSGDLNDVTAGGTVITFYTQPSGFHPSFISAEPFKAYPVGSVPP